MTVEEFDKEIIKHGFRLRCEGKHYRDFANEKGDAYPTISVYIEKCGTYVRLSTSFQNHRQCWIEDVWKDKNGVHIPGFIDKSEMCGNKCKDPMIHQCEFCLKYKEGKELR